MVIEALIVTAVASAMLGWNVHVIYRSGVCCPSQGGSHAEVSSSASTRSVHRSTTLRRRRRPSRRWLKEQQEAEAAAAAAVSGGSAGTKMEPITENLLTPSTEKAEVGTVNGEGVQGA